VYVRDGKRVVGFDNERGKGDRRHLEEKERAYHFESIDQLLDDFLAEVEGRIK
jgi:DNA-dependent RNA polymerase auxiliary subunit epsilon